MHPDHDGLLHRGREVLGEDVQVLAVLVLDPVTMREHKLIGTDVGLLRCWTDRPKYLGVLDAFPRWCGLRLTEPFRFGIADAEERRCLAFPEAAESAAFKLNHWGIQIG